MAGPRNSLRKPAVQVILFALGAILLYAFLARPVETINDFEIKKYADGRGFIFTASTANGLGVLYINQEDPFSLIPVDTFFRADRAEKIVIQENVLFMVDSRKGLSAWDIHDPGNISQIDCLPLAGSKQDLVVSGDYIYVAAGRSGLKVARVEKDNAGKVANPNICRRLPNVKTYYLNEVPGAALQMERPLEGVYLFNNSLYLVDRRQNIFLSDISSKEAPTEPQLVSVGEAEFNQINEIIFAGNFAMISAGEQGLVVMEMTNPTTWTLVQTVKTNGQAHTLDISGNYGYIANGRSGLMIVDKTEPSLLMAVPNPAPGSNTLNNATRAIVYEGLVYVSDGSDGIRVFSAQVNLETELLGRSSAPIDALAVVKAGPYAYIAAGERGLRILDVADPRNPRPLSFYDTPGESLTNSVAISGDIALLADGSNGLVVVDITNRFGPLGLLGEYKTDSAKDVVNSAGLVYLADGDSGLKVLRVSPPVQPTPLPSPTLAPGQTTTPGSPSPPGPPQVNIELVGYLDKSTRESPTQPPAVRAQAVTLSGSYAYLAGGDQGLWIVNVGDPTIPSDVARVASPQGDDARASAAIQLNGQTYVYVANGAKGLQVIDATNPIATPPSIVNEFATSGGQAVDVYVTPQLLYVAIDPIGFYVYSLADPAAPAWIGVYTMSGSGSGVAGLFVDGSQIYLAARRDGLRILQMSSSNSFDEIGGYASPGHIKSLAIQANHVYTADGMGGLWVFDVSDSKNPREVGFLQTPGAANGVVLSGSNAYLAGGLVGLQIVDLTDPIKPKYVKSVETTGEANAVIVIPVQAAGMTRNMAYIADGTGGLAVVDVTIPSDASLAGALQVPGASLALTFDRTYIFLAADTSGLTAASIADPKSPVLVSNFPPANPARAVAVKELYTYTAAGVNGLYIVDSSRPLTMNVANQIWPMMNVVNVATSQNYAFLAGGSDGLRILDATNPHSPVVVGEYADENQKSDFIQVLPVWQPPVSGDTQPGQYRLYVADETLGLLILSATKQAQIQQISLYDTPGTASFAYLFDYLRSKFSREPLNDQEIALYEEIQNGKASRTVHETIINIALIGVVGFVIWLGILAIFVLPISTYRDWENVYGRIVYYLVGRHGMAIRIRNGRRFPPLPQVEPPPPDPYGEGRRGPGVILADPSSAVVLERRVTRAIGGETSFTRVVGAGVVFTGNQVHFIRPRYEELVRGYVDLRPQFRLVPDVRGYTRDGIEVRTNVFAIFSLGEPPEILRVTYAGEETADHLRVIQLDSERDPDDRRRRIQVVGRITDELDADDKQEIHAYLAVRSGIARPLRQVRRQSQNSPYILDPERAFNAVVSEASDVPQNTTIAWDELPVMAATEVFRNLLSQQTYDQLYQPLSEDPSVFPIQNVRSNLSSQVRRLGVLAVQYVRRKDNQPLEQGQHWLDTDLILQSPIELRNSKVLRDRGICIRLAGFTELIPDDAVRLQFLENWAARQHSEAEIILADHELQAMRIRNQARALAQRDMVFTFAQILNSHDLSQEALTLRIYQELESLATDPATRQLLPGETLQMLRALRFWFFPDDRGVLPMM